MRVGDVFKKLPFERGYFDAVISTRALHHARIEDIRRAIGEMARVLKLGGTVYVTVRKRTKKGSRLGHKLIDSRTCVPVEGQEKGVVHYLFNKELLEREFKRFKNLDVWVERGPKEWECYYCLLGERGGRDA